MSSNLPNRLRAFADVVSIDAWHEEFSPERVRVDLHADVVFGTARLGGEAESQVRFRLGVKRAELVLVVPETEPFGVDRGSVARFLPNENLKQTITRKKEVKGSVDGEATLTGGVFGGKAKASGSVEKSEKVETTGSRNLHSIKITYRLHADNSNRWALEATDDGERLEDRPWDPVSNPLLALVDKRNDRAKGIPPAVRIEVLCRREDLVIDEIEIKEESRWKKFIGSLGKENHLKAAEAYIRNQLEEAGLEAGKLDEKFEKILLAHAFANNGNVS